MILLQQMIVLFLIMMTGYLCRKKKIFDENTSKKLSGIVVNVANPALIISASFEKEPVIQSTDLLKTLLLAVAIFAVLILIASFLPGILHLPADEQGTYKVMAIFSNIGFMGFPVISAVYGREALLYASLFLIPYNILIYTYGIRIMQTSRHKKKPEEKNSPSFQWKNIWNIGVISCLLTLLLYLFKIPLPGFVTEAVSSLSNLTAPLSMMIIGDSFTQMDLKKLFTDGKMLLFSGIKLLVLPVAGTLCIRLLGISPMLTGICMIMLSTPAGSMTAMLAQQYDGDYELASRGVALTTILSVATMPLVSMIMDQL